MSTWSDNLKIELLGIGDTNWGNLTNNNFKWAIEESITGYATAAFPSDADYDWAAGYTNTNASQAQRNLVINVTGSLTQTRNLVVPTIEKQYIVQNNTTGSQSIVVKTSAGTGITVPNGAKAHLYVDGTNVVQMVDYFVSPTLTGATVAGDITITGTGRRITGDFSNATVADRVAFQTSTVNSETSLGVIPNGTSPNSGFNIFNAANPTNAAFGGLLVGTTEFQIRSAITGSGTYLPMTFYTGGSERVRVDTLGNVGIGTSSPTGILHVGAGTGGIRVVFSNSVGVGKLEIPDNFASGPSLTFGNDTNTGFLRPSDDTIAVHTNGSERMRIDSSGNVGIETTTPAGRLDITSGTARMYFSNQTATAFFTAVNTTNTAYAPLAINGSELILKTGDAERMRIDSSGNVGIGGASFGSGTVVMFIANATAVPSANPSGGGVLYVEGGALKYRGSSGTVTTIANA
jgi:hypothetical protein